MQDQHFITSFLATQTPQQVFNAINNVTGWWSQDFEGASKKLNDEFSVRFGDVHYSKHKLVEVEPNEKIVWLVTESELSFLKDKKEWDDTKNVFEITREGDMTRVTFTHIGLVPEIECYKDCFNGWTYYINSLENLITKGIGLPNKLTNNNN